MTSGVNSGQIGTIGQTYGTQATAAVTTATLGPHTVTQGTLPSGPPATGGFGDKVKAFFSSLGEKLSSFASTLAALPDTIQTKFNAWRESARVKSEARDEISGWKNAGVDLESDFTTKTSQASLTKEALQNIGKASVKFGEAGVHLMAERMLSRFEAEAKANAGKADKPQTWQECATESFKKELLMDTNYASAAKKIDDLADHFATYARSGNHSKLAEMGTILAGLKAEVTQPNRIDGEARSAFTAELDGQMGQLHNFFRGNTDATVTSATLLRNANATQTANMIQAFSDAMSDPQNAVDVALADSITANAKPTTAQQQAVNNLTQKFFDRAFNLSGDGGAAFAQNLDPTARAFLSDTSHEIAGKASISVTDRNEGIRKWFSNGFALREFGPLARHASDDVKHSVGGNQVATNIVRIFGDVHANNTTRTKLGDEATDAYATFHAHIGPQVTAFLGLMGMATAV